MKTAIIVQCRLSSTRLPKKALRLLGGEPVLKWNLRCMKKVRADYYFLACDYDSESALTPIAKDCGFKIYAGSKDDVLERFCSLIQTLDVDVVLRATADNPFLFYEAAKSLLKDFLLSFPQVDYMTYNGLPHGSGVEVFSAASLLKAKSLTTSPYDHEHVGPALYNHPKTFTSIFKDAPKEFNFPTFRTTIDTYTDFKRAEVIVAFLDSHNVSRPYPARDVLCALQQDYIKNMILFVPSIQKGHGTGHLRRCISLAISTKGFLFLPTTSIPSAGGSNTPNGTDTESLLQTEELINYALLHGLEKWQLIRNATITTSNITPSLEIKADILNGDWSLVVTDLFCAQKNVLQSFSILGPVLSLDEGSQFFNYSDYLLDILPSSELKRKPNLFAPNFISLPKNRRREFPKKIKTALVCIGGEDPSSFTECVVNSLLKNNIEVTAISSLQKLKIDIDSNTQKKIKVLPPQENLSETFFLYDLVVTHFGFIAFESLAANCAVLLVQTSPLHKKLSLNFGFVCFSKKDFFKNKVRDFLENPTLLSNNYFDVQEHIMLKNKEQKKQNKNLLYNETLFNFVKNLSSAEKLVCPICSTKSAQLDNRKNCNKKKSLIVYRTPTHTFRRCPICSIIYLSFSTDSDVSYEAAYFDSEYKAQYGRTYLDDFESIKAQGMRRLKVIDKIFAHSITFNNGIKKSNANKPRGDLLDIGCAYGPFLSAAKDDLWTPYGSDISHAAINYVTHTLNFNAINSSFADFSPKEKFGFEQFDVITMWFVLEHIKKLGDTLCKINSMLKINGVFSFSTPSASGVSAKKNKDEFFNKSPRDDYTIWEIANTKKILLRFGFKVIKIVSTGHHPERHPFIKKHKIKKDSLIFSFINFLSHLLKNGDTYEVYCKKIGGIK